MRIERRLWYGWKEAECPHPTVQVRARESLIIVSYRLRSTWPLAKTLLRSWLTVHHAGRFAMGKAGKARKAGQAQARKNELKRASTQASADVMVLASVAATLAVLDAPTLGRPADPASAYALDMVRWTCHFHL